jgi:hypothetical protein
MNRSLVVFCVLVLLAPNLAAAQSETQTAQMKALEAIVNAANQICVSPPLEQHSDKVELSGQAKAAIAGALSKITDLGIQGAAKYTHSDSKGILQEQLAGAIKAGNDCRKDVLNTLKSMIPALNTAAQNTDLPHAKQVLEEGGSVDQLRRIADYRFAKGDSAADLYEMGFQLDDDNKVTQHSQRCLAALPFYRKAIEKDKTFWAATFHGAVCAYVVGAATEAKQLIELAYQYSATAPATDRQSIANWRETLK